MLGTSADHGRHAHHRVLRLTAAAATLVAVTIASAGHSGTAYAMNRTGSVSVSPTLAPLSQLTTFTVITTDTPEVVTATIGVEFTGSGNPTTVGQLSTQPDGYIGGTFPATGAVCGTNTVTLVDDSVAGDPVLTQLPITAYCPSIQLTPTTVAFAAEPTTVQLTGTGFVESSPVQIQIDGHTVTQTTSNANGDVAIPVTITGLGCTPHEITAQMPPAGAAATPANSASAPLTVTSCPSPPSQAHAPTLAANPDVVENGQVTHVTGTGFTPNSPVVLTWQPTSGSGSGSATQSGPTVTSDASGDIDDYLVVMLNDLYVPCDLVATQGTASASAPVLVQGGSMEPSTNNELVFRQ
jgi:hypothetical protein